jgi:hypothetical protein
MYHMNTWLLVPSVYEVGNLLLLADMPNCSMWFIRYTQIYITHRGNVIVTVLCPNSEKLTDMLSFQTCSHETCIIEKDRKTCLYSCFVCHFFALFLLNMSRDKCSSPHRYYQKENVSKITDYFNWSYAMIQVTG